MKILIGDDSSSTRGQLARQLEDLGHEVISVADGQAALQVILDADPPRLAILDWMMPQMTGVDVCRVVRSTRREPYTYIILLTVKDTPEDLVVGMEAGADDYVSKPYNVEELRARVRAGLRVVELQANLIAARDLLREEAMRDPLTGLLNRRGIDDVLARDCARASRERTPLAVLMVDLDHFKAINDTHGHEAGDQVLRELAGRLRRIIRPYDEVARVGGEEFVIVAPGCNVEGARAVAERVRRCVSATPVLLHSGVSIEVTCSIGVGMNQTIAPDVVVQAADVALYKAKTSGRNCVVFAAAT
ncbi:MAG TPA: diguanylate cyclase [Myxococcota bacterium]|nr:diguanylate cyclase [Myxococcota bacterium]